MHTSDVVQSTKSESESQSLGSESEYIVGLEYYITGVHCVVYLSVYRLSVASFICVVKPPKNKQFWGTPF